MRLPSGGAGRPGPVVVAVAVLSALLAGTLAWTTPWTSLRVPDREWAPADPLRDFTATEVAREDAYHAAARPPAYAGLALSVGAALALGLTPLGARLVTAASRRLGPAGRRWPVQVVAGTVAVLAVTRLAGLPFAARVEGVRRAAGLSTRSWWRFAADLATSFALEAALAGAALLALVGLGRALPRGWWAPAAAGGATLVVAVSFAYPLVVEPAFNRFTPMPPGELRSSLLRLAARDGVPLRDVLVADASRRTTTLNAYVSGLGATRRLVVYDTLLARASPEEVRSVVAHELGHAAERDVAHGTALGALGMATGVSVLALVLRPAVLRRAGARAVGDPRCVALVLGLVSVLAVATGPAQALVSRRIETRADLHALELTGDPLTFVRLQRSLAVAARSDLDPPPAVFAAFATHPTAPMRIAFARTWARANGLPVPPASVPVAGSGR